MEIYRENGISGFYSGIIPRLIANVSTLVLVSGATYVINKHFIRDREVRGYTADTMTVSIFIKKVNSNVEFQY